MPEIVETGAWTTDMTDDRLERLVDAGMGVMLQASCKEHKVFRLL